MAHLLLNAKLVGRFLADLPNAEGASSEVSAAHLSEPGERFDPSLKCCGSVARYIEIDDREYFRAECPKCSAHTVTVSVVEDPCN